MNAVKEIRDWLNSNRDFDRGLMLLLAYKGKGGDYSFIEQRQDAGRLFTALRDLYMQLKEQEEAPAAPAPATQVKKTVRALAAPGKRLPELEKLWGDYKVQQESLHAEMRALGKELPLSEQGQQRRAELARLLINFEERLGDIGKAFNYAKENDGALPSDFDIDDYQLKEKKPSVTANLTDADKVKQLKNSVMPNISKLKKKIAEKRPLIASLTGKELDKANEQLTKWEQQLQELEQQKAELSA